MCELSDLYAAADAAGQEAVEALVASGRIRPMVVGNATGLFGNGIDLSKPVYYVADGACGFAWVKVYPGNSKFARFLVKNGLARKSYSGGVDIWVSAYSQSVQKKEAYARAFANVVKAAGYKCYADSRLD